MSGAQRRLAVWGARAALVVGTLLLMAYAPGRWVSTFAVARPGDILTELRGHATSPEFYEQILTTVYHAIVPLLISAPLGVATAWLLWSLPKFRRPVGAYLSVAYTTPRVIFLPLFILWIGVGSGTIIFYVILACYFIFLFNALEGFNAAGELIVGVLGVIGLSKSQIFWSYLLPGARSYLLAAALIAFPTAVLGAIIGEMILGGGLGGWILSERASLNTAGLYAATLTATVFAALLNLVTQRLGERARRRLQRAA